MIKIIKNRPEQYLETTCRFCRAVIECTMDDFESLPFSRTELCYYDSHYTMGKAIRCPVCGEWLTTDLFSVGYRYAEDQK